MNMTLSKNAFGLAVGIIWGLCMLIWALTAAYLNWGAAAITIMQDIYPGFKAGIIGGIMGAIWGFVVGYIFGFLIALIYNKFSKNPSQPSQPQI
ncbi:bacteriophage holin [Patescibacteria group bacterium]|nr:bacteriophage holin [Patescibacteria group bacterium]